MVANIGRKRGGIRGEEVGVSEVQRGNYRDVVSKKLLWADVKEVAACVLL